MTAAVLAVMLAAGGAGFWLAYGRRTRSAQRALPDWEMSSHEDGRRVHVIPRDGIAHEDRWGACACHPAQANWTRDDGTTGWMYIHRPILTGGRR